MAEVSFLKRRTNHCTGCPLEGSKAVKNCHVPTELIQIGKRPPKEVDVLFVGEAPGADEDLKCRPFIGKSGQLVRSIITKYATDNYAIGNTVKCRPTDSEGNNRQPTQEERDHCIKYLWEDIHKIKPKKIVALGGISAGAFLQNFKNVSSIRGQEFKITTPEGDKSILLPTYHPAATFRNPYYNEPLQKDIKEALRNNRKRQGWDTLGKDIVISSVKRVRKFVEYLLYKIDKNAIVAFDVETYDGINRVNNRLISVGFSWDGKKGYSIPLDHPKAPWTPKELRKVKKLLKRLFVEKPRFKYWLGHNSKFELQQIHAYWGVWVTNKKFLDTMVMAHLLDENRISLNKEINPFSLKQLVLENFNISYEDQEVLKAREEGLLRNQPWKRVCKYNAMDGWATKRLWYKQKLDAGEYWDKAYKIMTKLIAPALLMFAVTEVNGFKIDLENLFQLQSENSELQKKMREIDLSLRENKYVRRVNKKLTSYRSGGMKPLFGSAWVFNPDKPDHLHKLFFDEMKLNPVEFSKKTKKPSLGKPFFSAYAETVPLCKKMQLRGEIKKMITSYLNQVRNFLENDPDCTDGRIRSSFHMIRTATGRTACTDPNTQQIPRGDSPYKKAVKNIFTVDPGNVLVSTDFSQGEIFLLAQTVRDKVFAKLLWRINKIRNQYWKEPNEKLAELLKTECDVHRQSASLLYDVSIKDVTKEQRQDAKSIVSFGLIYGQSVKTLAEKLGISIPEAEKKVRAFFSKFPESEKGLKKIEENVRKFYYVDSQIGRRRRLPGAQTSDRGELGRAERQAKNAPIQSLLSDLTLFQSSRLQNHIAKSKLKWKIVALIHDAILAEVPLQEVPMYIKTLRKIMMDVKSFGEAFDFPMIVPMCVDFDIGIAYGKLESVESWNKGENCLPKVLRRVAKQWQEKGYKVRKPDMSIFKDEEEKMAA